MANLGSIGNVANVIAGFGAMFLAPKGTTVPTLTGSVSDFGGAAWTQPGFTDDGCEFDYTPTNKSINVDETTADVQQILTAEKLVVSVKLAETTLTNLYFAMTGGVQVSATEITAGGLTVPNEFLLGFIGPSPSTNATREILIYRAISSGGVKMHYQRKDKLMYQCQFHALADSTQPPGAQLCIIRDF